MAVLNEKEKAMFDYINHRFEETGYSPSVRDIQAALGIGSTATVYTYIERLCEKGYLKKDAAKSRSLRPVGDSPVYRVPIVGKVTAGAPILAYEDNDGFVSFSPDKRRFDSSSLFALKVRGRSMINAGILDGDGAIVEKSDVAQSGEIVVALIDDEATVKRFYAEGGMFRLQPENDEYEPIFTDHVKILGKVVASIRYY